MGNHAAANETSIMKYYYNDLVDMNLLPSNEDEELTGIYGVDPRKHASKDVGFSIVKYNIFKSKIRIMENLHLN